MHLHSLISRYLSPCITLRGIDGRAAALARIIGNLGYTSVTPASTAESVSTTTISYGEGYEAEAREIAAKMNITRVEPNAQVTGVTLTIGTDFPSGDAMEKTRFADRGWSCRSDC